MFTIKESSLDTVDGAAVGQGLVVVATCIWQKAFTHVCSVPFENDIDVDRFEAMKTVDEAFAKGHTGQFLATLGRGGVPGNQLVVDSRCSIIPALLDINA